MHVKAITWESRNDFHATLQCEHCESTQRITTGYHDTLYHTKVIPAMTCRACGKNRAGGIPVVRNDRGELPVVSIDGAHASVDSGEVPLCNEPCDGESDTAISELDIISHGEATLRLAEQTTL